MSKKAKANAFQKIKEAIKAIQEKVLAFRLFGILIPLLWESKITTQLQLKLQLILMS